MENNRYTVLASEKKYEPLPYKTIEEAEKAAHEIAKKHPGCIITISRVLRQLQGVVEVRDVKPEPTINPMADDQLEQSILSLP